MNKISGIRQDRRNFLRSAAAGFALGALPYGLAQGQSAPLKIGVIGSGRIGSTLGGILGKGGHEAMFSSLDLQHGKGAAAPPGGKAPPRNPRDAGASVQRLA